MHQTQVVVAVVATVTLTHGALAQINESILTSLRRVLIWVTLTIIVVNVDLNSKWFTLNELENTISC